MSGVYGLLFEIAQNPSLTVSIPAIHIWSKLVRILKETESGQIMVSLLDICSARLIRYESFPEDSEDVTVLFLNEDIDTIPERHAFLGNYRRYCVEIIEVLVRSSVVDAFTHILSQATNVFQNLYRDQPPFQRMSKPTGHLWMLTTFSPNLFENVNTCPPG